ncbi:PfkB family carbohydrate kinase [Micromonospora coerulea]|uniref:PfkB family carbohydrate kinase n=1 Tax=Micromonospora coerulea TaxID=47856 RepID=UPI0019055E00|nr:PfkB family carbohydrate kinase [Micromonospora veneta]
MVTARSGPAPDVLVIGEVLVELTALEPLRDGTQLRLGFSGDALNAAAAAAAAGAHTCLLARVPDDELGDELSARVAALGVDTSLLLRTGGQHGLYLQHADPEGQREFVYVRRGSAGSSLTDSDVPEAAARAGVVLASGVACAISASARSAVHAAARVARCFIYDPNWRPRLVDAATAGSHLRTLAPYARLVTPAWPREAGALLGATPVGPAEACAALRALGARAVALTQGSRGVLLDDGGDLTAVPAYPVDHVADQTGAGDVLTGTVAARLALGDDLCAAVRLGAAAAALSLRGHGGTGYLASLDESRRLVARTSGLEVST